MTKINSDVFIFVTISLIITIIFSCNGDSKKIRIDFNNKKYGVFEYKVINKDTVLEGKAQYFYSNNRLEDDLMLKKGKKEGWSFHYDSLGKLLSKIYFHNDLQDSIAYNFDGNERIQFSTIYERGDPYLRIWKDNPDSSTIYNALSDTSVYYSVKYDVNGKIVEGKGLSMAPTLKYNCNKDSIKLNNSIVIKIPYVCIPGYKIALDAGLINLDKKNVIDLADKIQITKCYGLLRVKFDEAAIYHLIITSQLYNEKDSLIRRDTLIERIIARN